MADFTNRKFGRDISDPTYTDLAAGNDPTYAQYQGTYDVPKDVWNNKSANTADFKNLPRSDISVYGTARFGISRYDRGGTSWNNRTQEA